MLIELFWSFVVLVETGGNGLTDALTRAVDGLRTTDETTGRVKVVARQDNRQRRGIETKFFASTSRSSSW